MWKGQRGFPRCGGVPCGGWLSLHLRHPVDGVLVEGTGRDETVGRLQPAPVHGKGTGGDGIAGNWRRSPQVEGDNLS